MEQMLQSMMKRYAWFIGMGLMIVVAAFVIGAVNGANAAGYYAVDKATRDASVDLAQIRAGIERTVIWLPYFKFLGVAMILSGIVMALGVISTRLQNLGKEVMASVPATIRVEMPSRPKSVMMMRLFMMLGMLTIVVGFVISLNIANTAAAVFSNSVTVIDAAGSGSVLLTGLARIHATEAWLEAFKFVGVAFLFMSILNGLATILFALGYQKTAIPKVVENMPAASVAIPAGAD